MGTPGGKTNPEELFAARYAACFHGGVQRVAAHKKIAICRSTIVEVKFLRRTGQGGYVRADVG
jgi:lipoyl-dependent peroxiredoxin